VVKCAMCEVLTFIMHIHTHTHTSQHKKKSKNKKRLSLKKNKKKKTSAHRQTHIGDTHAHNMRSDSGASVHVCCMTAYIFTQTLISILSFSLSHTHAHMHCRGLRRTKHYSQGPGFPQHPSPETTRRD
jgi:hypothetical protein